MAQTPFTTGFVGSQTDVDNPSVHPEAKMSFGWPVNNPKVTFLDYRCWLEMDLDSGMVLHKPLPQFDYTPDQLGVIDAQSPVVDKYVGPGVGLQPNAVIADVIQRMATSTYRFVLRGYGLRAGYQVPVPTLRSIGGTPAIPERQWTSGQVVVANFAGVPVFGCRWVLGYIVEGPILSTAGPPIPYNPAQHIRPDAQLPSLIKLPQAPTDGNAVAQAAVAAPAANPVQRAAPNLPPNLQRGQ